MWKYKQSTGELFNAGGDIVTVGYSGAGDGKNNPALQHVHDVGPIPRGLYRVGGIVPNLEHGPLALELEPDRFNAMSGRSGFLLHGDSVAHPGAASHGCVILPRAVREAIDASADRALVVVD